MRFHLGGGIYLVAGAMLGLISAVVSVDRFAARVPVRGSTWTMWGTGTGTSFYASAHYLLGGRLPPAPAQTLELSASRDDSGNALDPRCTYLIEGKPGALTWWSLATASLGGTATRVEALLDSSSSVLDADGTLYVTVSPSPRAGNWIAPPAEKTFTLLFTAAQKGAGGSAPVLPQLDVTRSGC